MKGEDEFVGPKNVLCVPYDNQIRGNLRKALFQH